MKVFVLCGGEGTRLQPLTETVPKPMLTIGEKPILQHVLENLAKNGFRDLVLAVGYKRDQIIRHFGNGSKWELSIEYMEEETPQNTAGAILPYKGQLRETFGVVMGDHVTDVPFARAVEFHRTHPAIATLTLLPHVTSLEFGVVEVQDHRVRHFVEKPKLEHLINIGMYVLEPEIFDFIHEKEDFAKDIFPRLLSAKKPINGYVAHGQWHDVGRISDYERLQTSTA